MAPFPTEPPSPAVLTYYPPPKNTAFRKIRQFKPLDVPMPERLHELAKSSVPLPNYINVLMEERLLQPLSWVPAPFKPTVMHWPVYLDIPPHLSLEE